MERVNEVSSRRLHLAVVALHLVVVEEVPEEVTLLLAHFEHLFGDDPLEATILAGRNSRRTQVVPEIKGLSVVQMLGEIQVDLRLIRERVFDGLEDLA